MPFSLISCSDSWIWLILGICSRTDVEGLRQGGKISTNAFGPGMWNPWNDPGSGMRNVGNDGD